MQKVEHALIEKIITNTIRQEGDEDNPEELEIFWLQQEDIDKVLHMYPHAPKKKKGCPKQ